MSLRLFNTCFCLLMLALTVPTHAVMSGYGDSPPTSNHPDYAAGIAAFNRADWQGVIEHMTRVVSRRPWHDDAYSLMGYAYRQLGDYTQALERNQRALELNPYHRGALAYLGEAYVETGCMDHARTLLKRLRVACQRVTDTTSDSGQSDCEEWQALRDTIDADRQPEKADCPLPSPLARLPQ